MAGHPDAERQAKAVLALGDDLLGQEAAQIGSGRALQPDDMAFPTYREHGVAWCRGVEPESLLQLFRGVNFGGWDPSEHNFALYTIVIGHATFCIVTVYNNVLARLRRTQTSLVEASMDLGAGVWQTFRHITFPSVRTALLAGGLLAFALSFDEIVVTNTIPVPDPPKLVSTTPFVLNRSRAICPSPTAP